MHYFLLFLFVILPFQRNNPFGSSTAEEAAGFGQISVAPARQGATSIDSGSTLCPFATSRDASFPRSSLCQQDFEGDGVSERTIVEMRYMLGHYEGQLPMLLEDTSYVPPEEKDPDKAIRKHSGR